MLAVSVLRSGCPRGTPARGTETAGVIRRATMARRISPPSAALALCMLALLLQGGVSAAGHCVLIPASMRLVWYAMYTSYMWCQPAGGRRQRLLQEHEHELFPGRHPESPYLLTLMLNMMRRSCGSPTFGRHSPRKTRRRQRGPMGHFPAARSHHRLVAAYTGCWCAHEGAGIALPAADPEYPNRGDAFRFSFALARLAIGTVQP